MKLSNTKFVFIITSKSGINVDDRFFFDVAYFIQSINNYVCYDNIIIISNADKNIVASKINIFSKVNWELPSATAETIEKIETESLFIISNCHGSIEEGIDSPVRLSPALLTNAIKKANIKNAIAVFCQCYAGIYKHLSLESTDKRIVYIGATDLTPSISTPSLPSVSWSANITLCLLSEWLKRPCDIDGDGKLSVIDLYMFTSAYTNTVTHEIERIQNKKLIESLAKQQTVSTIASKSPLAQQLQKAAMEDFQKYWIPHQSMWIESCENPSKIYFEDFV